MVLLDPPKKKHVTLVGYSWNIQGIFIYSIFPEYYLEIFPEISEGTFSECSGNISWECSTNIPRIYICPVGSRKFFCYQTTDLMQIRLHFSFLIFTKRKPRNKSELVATFVGIIILTTFIQKSLSNC